jgi:hypothetical protein
VPILETCDPISYSDAQGKPEWEQAMQDEMNHLLKNHTWYFLTHPQGKDIVKCPWVYKTKFASKVLLSVINLTWLQKDFLNKNSSTIMRHLFMLPPYA